MPPAQIGPDNAFHWSGLGLLPYKDTFISNATSTQKSGEWTNDTKQWPSFKGCKSLTMASVSAPPWSSILTLGVVLFCTDHERNAATHALMSLLSMASVTFGDAVGESNKTLLMQLCREDGMLLKADRPATAIDAQFQAMMFDAWPGDSSSGSSGHGALFTTKCDPSNKMQQFEYDEKTKVLRLAGGKPDQGCIDVSGCRGSAGSAIHLYDNTLGNCGTVSTCKGTNEQWTMDQDSTSGATIIKSAMPAAKGQCLVVSGGSAQLGDCATEPAHWSVGRHRGDGPFSIETTTHDDQQCLTAAKPSSVQHGALQATPETVKEHAEALFPTATSEVSAGYRDAYATSDLLMESIDAKRALDEQCKGGFGAPQGPLGEIYSTHTTVGGMTWRYVVGVQVANDFNTTRKTLGISADDTTSYVRVDLAPPVPRAARASPPAAARR